MLFSLHVFILQHIVLIICRDLWRLTNIYVCKTKIVVVFCSGRGHCRKGEAKLRFFLKMCSSMRINQAKILFEEKIWSEDKFGRHYCLKSVQICANSIHVRSQNYDQRWKSFYSQKNIALGKGEKEKSNRDIQKTGSIKHAKLS